MSTRKLTPDEITRTVAKIREKYGEYSYKYFKSASHKSNFEDRYVQALKRGVDISSFLLAEISAIEELVAREEEKVLNRKINVKSGPEKGFADQIIEDNKKKIEKYPDMEIHKDANAEIRRMYGGLNNLLHQKWPNLFQLLKNSAFSMSNRTIMSLEQQLHTLGGSGREGVPARLERYVAKLGRFPRDYTAIDKEEKDYLLESAFLLHGLADSLTEAREKNSASMTDQEREQLQTIVDYIKDMISDFRLKDLKKR